MTTYTIKDDTNKKKLQEITPDERLKQSHGTGKGEF